MGAGFIGELVRALELNRDLLDSAEFKRVAGRIASDFRWAWDELLEMVGDGEEGGKARAPIAKLMVRLRSRLSSSFERRIWATLRNGLRHWLSADRATRSATPSAASD